MLAYPCLRMPLLLAYALSCAMLLLLGGMPAAQAQLAARASAMPAERGVGLYQGRRVVFRIVDGWAVVEGDIIIGRADELSEALRTLGRDPEPRGLPIGYQYERWLPGSSGVVEVPYVVSADPGGKVPQAVAEFNATFAGVIQFVSRTTQPDYVDFTMNLPPGSPACTSFVGRIGGPQVINGPPDCPVGALLHEMGHAIGLLHEQNRVDRDQYIMWQPQNAAKNARLQSAIETFNRKIVTPYDYGSIMHYDDFAFQANGLPTHVTIPPGIEIGQTRGFSAADIDTVRRLYGLVPAAITVTTAPPGLAVVVDGQTVTTPATFAWPMGSTHTIDVPAGPQSLAGVPYLFGRWNVDVVGDQAAQRTIRIDPGPGAVGMPSTAPAVTVYTANFVRHYAFTLGVAGDTAAARAATTATLSPQPQPIPGLPGLYFRAGEVITLSGGTTGGVSFGGWFGSSFRALDGGFASEVLAVTPFDPTLTAGTMQAVAYGSQGPIARLRTRGNDGTVDGHIVRIDSTSVLSPFTSAYSLLGGTAAHQVTAPTPQFNSSATTRYVFTDWDGSSANPISVTKPVTGQPSRDYTANFAAAHRVTLEQASSCTGAVLVANASGDGFYDHGRVIAVTATAAAGWQFLGWSDDLTGSAAAQSVAVNGEVYATAHFNLAPERFAVSGTSRLFAAAGDPGFTLTVYGSGFAPTSVVFVGGFSRATTFVDSNRLRATLTAADLATPGELRISVGNVRTGCGIIEATGLAVQESGFTWPATVQVVEFYHAALDHYFVTANADEMAKLDNGTFKGWARTGLSFKGFPADSLALGLGLARVVCRFYGNPAAGLDSHFYSAFREECDDVKRKFPTSWVFESSDVFQAVTPDRITGACPDGTIPVYRLFNGRTDANHRYTTDAGVRAQMIAKGYVPEGYGPEGVALCALA